MSAHGHGHGSSPGAPLSPEQAAIFGRLYPMNARPVQPGSGRLIKESN